MVQILSCDTLDGWYTNTTPTPANMFLFSLNTTDQIEGSACVEAVTNIAEFPPPDYLWWGQFFYATSGADPAFDLQTNPILRIRMQVQLVNGHRMFLNIGTAVWNNYNRYDITSQIQGRSGLWTDVVINTLTDTPVSTVGTWIPAETRVFYFDYEAAGSDQALYVRVDDVRAEVELAQQGNVRFIVTEQTTGLPIPDAQITTTILGSPVYTTDPSGIAVITGVNEGDYSATISALGFIDVVDYLFHVYPQTETPYQVIMQPTPVGNVALTVRDAATHAALPGATVVMQGPTTRTGLTDSEGQLAFAGIPTGIYSVNTSLAGYSTQTVQVTVAEGNNIFIIDLEATAPQPFYPPVHREGNQLVDAQGNTVYLRGAVKGVCQNDQPGGNWPVEGGGPDSGWNSWDPARIRWHFQIMKSLGFTAWRCFGWNLYMWRFRDTDPNSALAVQNMIQAIQIANEEGLYVIAAPYGVSNDRAIEATDYESIPFPPYLQGARATSAITSEQDFVDVWTDIATTLAPYPNLLFELYNEPNWPLWGNFDRTQATNDYFRVMQDAINGIRSVSNTPIVVQWRPAIWYNDSVPANSATLQWVYDYPLTGGNIVVSTHDYRAYGAWGTIDGETPHTYQQVSERIGFLLSDVWMYHPVLIGEIGCDMTATGTALTETLEAYDNVLRLFNEWGIDYTAFNYRSVGMFRLFDTQPWVPPLSLGGEILVARIGGAAPPPIEHTLTVNSSPIEGVPFTIDGTQTVTPYAESRPEGAYTITMPSNVQVDTETYTFRQWEDATTNPVRIITLAGNLTVSATYEVVTPPPDTGYIEAHAFTNGLEIDVPGVIVETSETFNTGPTGTTITVSPGSYTVRFTYQGVTRSYSVTVADQQTVRVDAQFGAPVPISPELIAVALGGAALVTVILAVALK